jgi:hypothetical protein
LETGYKLIQFPPLTPPSNNNTLTRVHVIKLKSTITILFYFFVVAEGIVLPAIMDQCRSSLYVQKLSGITVHFFCPSYATCSIWTRLDISVTNLQVHFLSRLKRTSRQYRYANISSHHLHFQEKKNKERTNMYRIKLKKSFSRNFIFIAPQKLRWGPEISDPTGTIYSSSLRFYTCFTIISLRSLSSSHSYRLSVPFPYMLIKSTLGSTTPLYCRGGRKRKKQN